MGHTVWVDFCRIGKGRLIWGFTVGLGREMVRGAGTARGNIIVHMYLTTVILMKH